MVVYQTRWFSAFSVPEPGCGASSRIQEAWELSVADLFLDQHPNDEATGTRRLARCEDRTLVSELYRCVRLSSKLC